MLILRFGSVGAHNALRADGVRVEILTVVTVFRSSFPRSGEVEVGPLGQAKIIVEQGAQQERGGWASPTGLHHLLKSTAGASRRRNWLPLAGGRPPPRVLRTVGLPLLPTTFPPAVTLEGSQSAPPDGEAGFLPAVQSET